MFDSGGLFDGKAKRVRQRGTAIIPVPRGPAIEESVKRRHIRVDVPSRVLPVPVIARATLLALGCFDAGRSEKVAWRVPFDFDGVPCALEDQKLGVNLHFWPPSNWDDATASAFEDRVLTTLRKVIHVAETDIFYPAIRSHITRSEVALNNQAGDLRSAYSFFRQMAEDKGARNDAPSGNTSAGDLDANPAASIANSLNGELARIRQRKHLANAMVVAFFAYLEHYLALALPFSDADLSRINIMNFLGTNWGEKFKTVIDIQHSPEPKRLYDRLIKIAETHRNPRAHGHDKLGSTIRVVLEGIGTVPVMLSGIEDTPIFRIDPFDDETFGDIVATFDEVEELILGPALGNAGSWITGGFDVFLEEADSYRQPQSTFADFKERRAFEWERQANMDW